MSTERSEHILSFRRELIYLIHSELSPLAKKYFYLEHPLESQVSERPIVLLLGDYSSGKSTLINELIGEKIQRTSLAPTDDKFTLLTCDPTQTHVPQRTIYEEVDGVGLFSDTSLPFHDLAKLGDKVADLFHMKKVQAPILKNMILIDTPGLLDHSSRNTEEGKLQLKILKRLAQIADLTIALFDPHKAASTRDFYKEILPEKISSDRTLFVMNRIDECQSIDDLLQVHGTLCFGLARDLQFTEMPHILLTCSQKKEENLKRECPDSPLHLIKNQRKQLIDNINRAPIHQLSHTVSYLNKQTAHLTTLLNALIDIKKKRRLLLFQTFWVGLAMSLFLSGVICLYFYYAETFGKNPPIPISVLCAGLCIAIFSLWQMGATRFAMRRYDKYISKNIDSFFSDSTLSENQELKNSALRAIKSRAFKQSSLSRLKREKKSLERILTKGTNEFRAVLKEIHKTN